jgi:hypothetical protein
MDFEPGPMQGDYRLYDEPYTITTPVEKGEVAPSEKPMLKVGDVAQLLDGSWCLIAAIDKDGQPWCEVLQ